MPRRSGHSPYDHEINALKARDAREVEVRNLEAAAEWKDRIKKEKSIQYGHSPQHRLDSPSLLQKAARYFQTRRYEEAVEVLRRVLIAAPGDEAAREMHQRCIACINAATAAEKRGEKMGHVMGALADTVQQEKVLMAEAMDRVRREQRRAGRRGDERHRAPVSGAAAAMAGPSERRHALRGQAAEKRAAAERADFAELAQINAMLRRDAASHGAERNRRQRQQDAFRVEEGNHRDRARQDYYQAKRNLKLAEMESDVAHQREAYGPWMGDGERGAQAAYLREVEAEYEEQRRAAIKDHWENSGNPNMTVPTRGKGRAQTAGALRHDPYMEVLREEARNHRYAGVAPRNAKKKEKTPFDRPEVEYRKEPVRLMDVQHRDAKYIHRMQEGQALKNARQLARHHEAIERNRMLVRDRDPSRQHPKNAISKHIERMRGATDNAPNHRRYL